MRLPNDASLSANLRLWLKADDATMVSTYTDGAKVPTWYSSGGNVGNATQSNATYQPTYKTNIVNGKPVVRMDASNYIIMVTATTPTDIQTAFVVTRNTLGCCDNVSPFGWSGGQEYLGGTSGSPVFRIAGHLSQANATAYLNGLYSPNDTSYIGTTINRATSLQNFGIITVTCTVGTTINQYSQYAGNAGSNWKGDYAEIILYNRVLTLTEIRDIEYYLALKYKITAIVHHGGTDTVSPPAISNLSVVSSTYDSVTLSWTSVGDDNATDGANKLYQIRAYSSIITDGNWATAEPIANSMVPQWGGSTETVKISGLNPGTTYYFAVKSVDWFNNVSPASNSPTVTLSGTLQTNVWGLSDTVVAIVPDSPKSVDNVTYTESFNTTIDTGPTTVTSAGTLSQVESLTTYITDIKPTSNILVVSENAVPSPMYSVLTILTSLTHTFTTPVVLDAIGTESFIITIRNDGTENATITPIKSRGFSVNITPVTVAPGATYDYVVYANPYIIGTNTDSVSFISSNGMVSQPIVMSCTGVSANDCVVFTAPIPVNSPQYSTISFYTNDSGGVRKKKLNVQINGGYVIQKGVFVNNYSGSIVYINGNFQVSIASPSSGWGYSRIVRVDVYTENTQGLRGLSSLSFTVESVSSCQTWTVQSDFQNNISNNPSTDYYGVTESDSLNLIPPYMQKFTPAQTTTYTSNVLSYNKVVTLSSIDFSGYLNGNSSVTFQIAASNTDSFTDSQWNYVGYDGTSATYFDSTHKDLSSISGQYFRFKIYISKGNDATNNRAEVYDIKLFVTSFWKAKVALPYPKLIKQVQLDKLTDNPTVTYNVKVRSAANVDALSIAPWSNYLSSSNVNNSLVYDLSGLYLLCKAYEVSVEATINTTLMATEAFGIELPVYALQAAETFPETAYNYVVNTYESWSNLMAWDKIFEGNITTTSDYTISNLNGDVDKEYFIILEGNCTGSTADRLINIQPNGDTSSANYVQGFYWEAFGAGSSNGANTQSAVGVTTGLMIGKNGWSSNGFVQIKAFMNATSSVTRMVHSQYTFIVAGTATNQVVGGSCHSAWKDTTSVITSLKINFGSLTGFTGVVKILALRQ